MAIKTISVDRSAVYDAAEVIKNQLNELRKIRGLLLNKVQALDENEAKDIAVIQQEFTASDLVEMDRAIKELEQYRDALLFSNWKYHFAQAKAIYNARKIEERSYD